MKITVGKGSLLLECCLIKTTKRITFDIVEQSCLITNTNDSGILEFRASNGYDIISEHRMDIQSRRIWLHGAANDQPANRSGTMAVPTQGMTDEIFPQYVVAFEEWAAYNKGRVEIHVYDFTELKEKL